MFVDEADFESVQAVCATLCTRGVVLGDQGRSVGPWTTAVADGYAWAVLGRHGQPLFLAHDAYEAAVAFCRLEAWYCEEDDLGPGLALPDAFQVEVERFDKWLHTYRYEPWGDPSFIPPAPGLARGGA